MSGWWRFAVCALVAVDIAWPHASGLGKFVDVIFDAIALFWLTDRTPPDPAGGEQP